MLVVSRRDLPESEKGWWHWQRSYWRTRAVLEEVEGRDLNRLLRCSGSKAGLKRLRQALRKAQPLEYRKTG